MSVYMHTFVSHHLSHLWCFCSTQREHREAVAEVEREWYQAVLLLFPSLHFLFHSIKKTRFLQFTPQLSGTGCSSQEDSLAGEIGRKREGSCNARQCMTTVEQ